MICLPDPTAVAQFCLERKAAYQVRHFFSHQRKHDTPTEDVLAGRPANAYTLIERSRLRDNAWRLVFIDPAGRLNTRHVSAENLAKIAKRKEQYLIDHTDNTERRKQIAKEAQALEFCLQSCLQGESIEQAGSVSGLVTLELTDG